MKPSPYAARIIRCLKPYADGGAGLIIGCGKSLIVPELLAELAPAKLDLLDYRADNLNFQKSLLAKARPLPDFFRADLNESGWYANLYSDYNFIICTEVLEHLNDPAKALKRISARLKTGGAIFLSTPTSVSEKTMNAINPAYMSDSDGGSGHIHIFDKKRLAGLADGAGLTVTELGKMESPYTFYHLILNGLRVRLDSDTGELTDERPLQRLAARGGARMVRLLEKSGAYRLFDPIIGRSYYLLAEKR